MFFTFAWDAASRVGLVRGGGFSSPFRRVRRLLYPCPEKAAATGVGSHHLVSATPNCHGTFCRTCRLVPAAGVHRPAPLRDLSGLLSGAAHRRGSGRTPSFHLRVESIRSLVRDFTPSTPTSTNFSAEPHPATGRRPNATPSATVPCENACGRQGRRPWKPFAAQLQAEGHRVSESYLFRLLHRDAGVAPRGNAAEPNRNRASTPAMVRWCPPWPCATTGPDHRSAVHHPGRGLVSVRPTTARSGSSRRGASGGLARFRKPFRPCTPFWPCCCRNCWSHLSASVTSAICAPDEGGAGLWAGLNVLPKTTYATDYSSPHRPHHARTPHRGPDRQNTPGEGAHTFSFDFHAIPFRVAEPDLEKHWVPLRTIVLCLR